MQTLRTTAGYSLHYDPQEQCLLVQWRGKFSQRAILAVCADILASVQRTGCTKILNDVSQDMDGWSKMVHWVAKDYFQQLAANGVRAVAWVLPRNLTAQIDTLNTVYGADN